MNVSEHCRLLLKLHLICKVKASIMHYRVVLRLNSCHIYLANLLSPYTKNYLNAIAKFSLIVIGQYSVFASWFC